MVVNFFLSTLILPSPSKLKSYAAATTINEALLYNPHQHTIRRHHLSNCYHRHTNIRGQGLAVPRRPAPPEWKKKMIESSAYGGATNLSN